MVTSKPVTSFQLSTLEMQNTTVIIIIIIINYSFILFPVERDREEKYVKRGENVILFFLLCLGFYAKRK